MSLPLLFLSHFSNDLYFAAEVVFTMLFIYGLKTFVFLEYNTGEQKKKIKRMFLIAGTSLFVFGLLILIFQLSLGLIPENSQLVKYITVIYYISFALFIVMPFVFGYIAIIYSSVTARKKAKWLGIFVVLPMDGYSDMLFALVNIPFELIPFDVNSPYYAIYENFYRLFWNIFFIILIYRLFYSKNRPAFIKKIEADIKERSLSAWEEAAIWLVGIWMAVYFNIISSAKGIPTWTVNLGLISNFILGIVITVFVVSNSYRKYYYEKNIKYQKTLITTMANLVESRDDNTGGHIHRTAKYVEIIARKLKKEGKFKEILTDEYISDMVVAAPLHDVGKIHISDVILNKPGRLNDDEFAQMKSHSAAGGEIIGQVEDEVGEKISYLDIAKDMAEYHHERMDGRGYPHGIQGGEIPVCARILAVADVFDALISKRCYKDAMPLEQAFAIIREETGDHFDPDIAQAFLDSRDEVEQYLNDMTEEEKAGG